MKQGCAHKKLNFLSFDKLLTRQTTHTPTWSLQSVIMSAMNYGFQSLENKKYSWGFHAPIKYILTGFKPIKVLCCGQIFLECSEGKLAQLI